MSFSSCPRGADRERQRWLLALACLASFGVVLDATIVSIALPQIRDDRGLSPTQLPWVVNAYTLVFAGCLLLGGRLTDILGQRTILLLGLVIFNVARVACGLASDSGWLLALRALQGLGGALLMPASLALITSTFTDLRERTKALALWSTIGAVGAASGPVLGGLLAQGAGWQWVFLITAPLTVIGVAITRTRVPNTRPRRGSRTLDAAGAVLGTLGLGAFVFAVMEVPARGWASNEVVSAGLVAVVALSLFFFHQAKWSSDPLLPLWLFSSKTVASGNLVMLLLGLGFFASSVLMSLELQDVYGYDVMNAGLIYLPTALAMAAGAQTAGWLTNCLGPRHAAVASCVTAALGAAGLAGISAVDARNVGLFIAAGVVFGLGSAAAFTPITVVATQNVPGNHGGVAAALLNTVRQTSGAIGLAVLTAIAAAASTFKASGEALNPHTMSFGYGTALAASAGVLVAAALVANGTVPRGGYARGSASGSPTPRISNR